MIKKFGKILDYEVPEKLQNFVVNFILDESEKNVHQIVPIFPTGFPLIVNVYGDKPSFLINEEQIQPTTRLHIAGQVWNAKITSEINGQFGQVGVVLYPTALYYLFHQAGKNFTNNWKSFKENSPVQASELVENLAKSNSVKNRIDLLINFIETLVEQRLPSIDWLDSSLIKIFNENGKISQEDLIEKSGVSSRHYRRIFKQVIGTSPKYFCKIIQLNTVFEMLSITPSAKFYHLALECGYYDQAHFINDFKRFIGESPERFLNGKDSYLKSYMGRRGI